MLKFFTKITSFFATKDKIVKIFSGFVKETMAK